MGLSVFPTHVGVFPQPLARRATLVGLPHARGGVSCCSDAPPPPGMSSPRTWGCFHQGFLRVPLKRVFPTHVGVFLQLGRYRGRFPRLPHARGGVSHQGQRFREEDKSSPRTWGCFCYIAYPMLQNSVFPTHVGVFLQEVLFLYRGRRLPHARGGVSGRRCCIS